VEHIKQTEIDIQELKKKIAQVRKEIKDQDKIYKAKVKEIQKMAKGKNTRFTNTVLFEPTHSDGIEIFQIAEDEEEINSEELEEDEI
jgi:predicted site-specific integrase-resolvase